MILSISNASFVELAGVRPSAAAQGWQPWQVSFSHGADDDAASSGLAWQIVSQGSATWWFIFLVQAPP